MTAHKHALAQVLHQVAKFVDSLSDEELTHLAKGTARLSIQLAEKPGQGEASSRRRKSQDASAWPFSEDPPEQVASDLRSSSSREDGYKLLEKYCPTKASLQTLARHLDLHVLRDDDATMIRDKIVEATIGFRLRSNAVRGATPDTDG